LDEQERSLAAGHHGENEADELAGSEIAHCHGNGNLNDAFGKGIAPFRGLRCMRLTAA